MWLQTGYIFNAYTLCGHTKTPPRLRTYTESTPHRRRVALLGLVLPAHPADAHRPQDDARHSQAHLQQGQQEQAPQDLAAGAHPAPGISPAPGRERRRRDGSPPAGAPGAAWLPLFTPKSRSTRRRKVSVLFGTRKTGSSLEAGAKKSAELKFLRALSSV